MSRYLDENRIPISLCKGFTKLIIRKRVLALVFTLYIKAAWQIPPRPHHSNLDIDGQGPHAPSQAVPSMHKSLKAPPPPTPPTSS